MGKCAFRMLTIQRVVVMLQTNRQPLSLDLTYRLPNSIHCLLPRSHYQRQPCQWRPRSPRLSQPSPSTHCLHLPVLLPCWTCSCLLIHQTSSDKHQLRGIRTRYEPKIGQLMSSLHPITLSTPPFSFEHREEMDVFDMHVNIRDATHAI